MWAGASLLAGYGGIRFLASSTMKEGLPGPFRSALGLNEEVWGDLFRNSAMAPTFSPSERSPVPRVNGGEGLADDFDPFQWSLSVENVDGHLRPLTLTLDDIKRLPRHEFTTQLCCIEGWNFVVTWAGARFADFAGQYRPPGRKGMSPDLKRLDTLARYVYMETPGAGYYVGLDMQSALHPQTLLCYEMNGKPLPAEHGAPLRLVIPTKYGIKNIKRIGLIRYTDEKPKDYWAEQGYDWFAGL